MEQVNAGMRVARRRIDHFCHHPGSLLHGAGKKLRYRRTAKRQRAG